MAKILVIDDERSVRNTLKDVLEYEGHQVDVAHDAEEGISKNKSEEFDFILCDAKYAHHENTDFIGTLRQEHPDIHVVMTSRELDLDHAIECMKKGAYDFLAKPTNLNKLLNAIKASMDKSLAKEENPPIQIQAPSVQRRRQAVRRPHFHVDEIIGSSP